MFVSLRKVPQQISPSHSSRLVGVVTIIFRNFMCIVLECLKMFKIWDIKKIDTVVVSDMMGYGGISANYLDFHSKVNVIKTELHEAVFLYFGTDRRSIVPTRGITRSRSRLSEDGPDFLMNQLSD